MIHVINKKNGNCKSVFTIKQAKQAAEKIIEDEGEPYFLIKIRNNFRYEKKRKRLQFLLDSLAEEHGFKSDEI